MEQYEALLRDFIIVAKKHITPVALNELKIYYANLINSVRTLDRIHDIDQLIRVLENRGVIRYDNIIPLKNMAKTYFKNSPINERLEDYNQYNASCYPANVNLYRFGNGEFYLGNEYFNNLSSSVKLENRSPIDTNLQSCLEYQFACKLPFHIISGKDSSNYDNSGVFSSSLNDRSNIRVPFQNNSINKNNLDINDIDKNCNNHKLHVIHNIIIPPSLVLKNEQTVIIPNKTVTPLIAEENLNEINNAHKTPFLSTPYSHQSQTTCSSQIENTLSDPCHSLINSSVTTNFNTENSYRKLIQNRQVWIVLSAVSFLLLSIPIIIFYLLKYPVQYNPEPSAPSFQEVYSRSTEPPINPYAEHHLPLDPCVPGLQNQTQEYSVQGVTCIPVVPRLHRETISKIEQIKQHTSKWAKEIKNFFSVKLHSEI